MIDADAQQGERSGVDCDLHPLFGSPFLPLCSTVLPFTPRARERHGSLDLPRGRTALARRGADAARPWHRPCCPRHYEAKRERRQRRRCRPSALSRCSRRLHAAREKRGSSLCPPNSHPIWILLSHSLDRRVERATSCGIEGPNSRRESEAKRPSDRARKEESRRFSLSSFSLTSLSRSLKTLSPSPLSPLHHHQNTNRPRASTRPRTSPSPSRAAPSPPRPSSAPPSLPAASSSCSPAASRASAPSSSSTCPRACCS